MLHAGHRVFMRRLPGQTGLRAGEAGGGAVMLIQRIGLATDLDIHLHRLVPDSLHHRGTAGDPESIEVQAPTDEP